MIGTPFITKAMSMFHIISVKQFATEGRNDIEEQRL